jgi:predicted PurR-regulated permease PerM
MKTPAPVKQSSTVPLTTGEWLVRVSIIGLFVIALGTVLHLLGRVVVPLVLAWVLATVLLPIVDALARRGVPRVAAAFLVALAFFAVVAVLVAVLTVPATYWVSRADELGQLLREKLSLVRRPLDTIEHLGAALNQVSAQDAGPSVHVDSGGGMFGKIIGFLTPLVDSLLILVVGLVFHLIYQNQIQETVAGLIADPERRSQSRLILSDIQRNMTLFFGTIAVVNICLGFVLGLIVYLLGYPHPLLWGVLAAVLNFVPYVGPIVVVVTLLVAGLIVSNSIGHALLAPMAFLGLNVLEAHAITPALIGHRLTINPFLVFVSIAFWTWMRGPVGAFVATRLLISLLVVAHHLGAPTGASAAAATSDPR